VAQKLHASHHLLADFLWQTNRYRVVAHRRHVLKIQDKWPMDRGNREDSRPPQAGSSRDRGTLPDVAPVAAQRGSEQSSRDMSSFADHCRVTRRHFIGPKPKKVVADDAELDDVHYDKILTDFVKQHGRSIFLKMGGHEEDWDDNALSALRQRFLEMKHADILSRKGKKRGISLKTEWDGSSFEVGNVLGVSMLDGSKSSGTMSFVESPSTPGTPLRSPSAINGSPRSASTTGHTVFLSALDVSTTSQSEQAESSANDSSTSLSRILGKSSRLPVPPTSHPSSSRRHAVSKSADMGKSIVSVRSILSISGGKDVKGKAVHYADGPAVGSGSQSAVPPNEVLTRDPEEIVESSAAAAVAAAGPGANDILDDIVMRDRMLVRTTYCSHGNLKRPFGEKECKTTQGMEKKEWAEFLVVWRRRKKRLELYEDYVRFYFEGDIFRQ